MRQMEIPRTIEYLLKRTNTTLYRGHSARKSFFEEHIQAAEFEFQDSTIKIKFPAPNLNMFTFGHIVIVAPKSRHLRAYEAEEPLDPTLNGTGELNLRIKNSRILTACLKLNPGIRVPKRENSTYGCWSRYPGVKESINESDYGFISAILGTNEKFFSPNGLNSRVLIRFSINHENPAIREVELYREGKSLQIRKTLEALFNHVEYFDLERLIT